MPVDIEVFSTVPPTDVVDELSSTEYPIAETGCPEQLADDAERLNGEVTTLPLLGLLTLGSPDEEADPLTVTATSVNPARCRANSPSKRRIDWSSSKHSRSG